MHRETNQGIQELKQQRTENPREDDNVGAVAYPCMRLQGQSHEKEMGARNKSETKERVKLTEKEKGKSNEETTSKS